MSERGPLDGSDSDSAVRHPGLVVLPFAVVDPSVPGLEAVSFVDDLGAGAVVGDVIVQEVAAGHAAIRAVAHAGVAPIVVIDLEIINKKNQ